MLDIDEMAAYEAWKEHKITTSTDISVGAFNLESEAVALAWEAGWRAHEKSGSPESYAANPYRQKGMSGYINPSVKKVTS